MRDADALDAWRALAALVVLLCHLAQVFWQSMAAAMPWLVDLFATLARHAVLVFFLLSGYLIAHGLRRNVQMHGGRFAVSEYVLARIARLYPPLLGALVLTALVVLLVAGLTRGATLGPAPGVPPLQAAPVEFVSALLFIAGLEQSNPVLWSLNMEARLYLAAALAAWGFSRAGIWHPGCVGAIAVLAAGSVENPLFVVCALVWLLGAAIALGPASLQSWRRGASWLALAICVLLLGLAPRRLSILETDPWLQGMAQLLAALAYAALVFDLRWPATVVRRLAPAAGFSYTLYLVHWPILVLVLALGSLYAPLASANPLLLTITAAVSALVVARMLAARLERPAYFRAWLQRLRRSSARPEAGS